MALVTAAFQALKRDGKFVDHIHIHILYRIVSGTGTHKSKFFPFLYQMPNPNSYTNHHHHRHHRKIYSSTLPEPRGAPSFHRCKLSS